MTAESCMSRWEMRRASAADPGSAGPSHESKQRIVSLALNLFPRRQTYRLAVKSAPYRPSSAQPILIFWNVALGEPLQVRNECLEVFRSQARMLCDPRQHPGANLVLIVKRELIIRPIEACQEPVGTALPFYAPADPLQRGKNPLCLTGWPIVHPEA